jgi:hypothetical protein
MFKDIVASKDTSSLVYNLGITLLIIIISAFILRWLWNKVLVPHVTVLKPVQTLLDAFLLSIAIAVIRGS